MSNPFIPLKVGFYGVPNKHLALDKGDRIHGKPIVSRFLKIESELKRFRDYYKMKVSHKNNYFLRVLTNFWFVYSKEKLDDIFKDGTTLFLAALTDNFFYIYYFCNKNLLMVNFLIKEMYKYLKVDDKFIDADEIQLGFNYLKAYINKEDKEKGKRYGSDVLEDIIKKHKVFKRAGSLERDHKNVIGVSWYLKDKPKASIKDYIENMFNEHKEVIKKAVEKLDRKKKRIEKMKEKRKKEDDQIKGYVEKEKEKLKELTLDSIDNQIKELLKKREELSEKYINKMLLIFEKIHKEKIKGKESDKLKIKKFEEELNTFSKNVEKSLDEINKKVEKLEKELVNREKGLDIESIKKRIVDLKKAKEDFIKKRSKKIIEYNEIADKETQKGKKIMNTDKIEFLQFTLDEAKKTLEEKSKNIDERMKKLKERLVMLKKAEEKRKEEEEKKKGKQKTPPLEEEMYKKYKVPETEKPTGNEKSELDLEFGDELDDLIDTIKDSTDLNDDNKKEVLRLIEILNGNKSPKKILKSIYFNYYDKFVKIFNLRHLLDKNTKDSIDESDINDIKDIKIKVEGKSSRLKTSKHWYNKPIRYINDKEVGKYFRNYNHTKPNKFLEIAETEKETLKKYFGNVNTKKVRLLDDDEVKRFYTKHDDDDDDDDDYYDMDIKTKPVRFLNDYDLNDYVKTKYGKKKKRKNFVKNNFEYLSNVKNSSILNFI